ncbi:MAG TPA: acetyl-CoA C-acetyltransferase [Polyangiaceae bacterium]|nr:acetyl-CoA C-acetyltransferase [Polyangiaceae bacterium]
MSQVSSVYIVSAARTPVGAFLGSLASLPAPRLGAVAIRAALDRAKLSPDSVGEVLMGNVLSAGIGQAPARQASIYAGIPNAVPTQGVSRVCGSGLQAVILGAKSIALGDADIVVAGGMESMSNVPYYLQKARNGYRMGDGAIVDGMIFDGLFDPYNQFHMGEAAELCVKEFQVSREAQDEFAKESYRRAQLAQKDGSFKSEIVSVEIAGAKGDKTVVSEDEEPKRFMPEKMASLKPAFRKDGTITAANASKINDGAAAVVLASERAVKERGLTPLARIAGYSSAAQAPEWFTTAPAVAIDRAVSRLGLTTRDIDLYEINEAFAVVAIACAKQCGIDLATVNVRGGAVALGHPIGASGARVLTTLLYAMADKKAKRGLATLCIGGGEAAALVVER